MITVNIIEGCALLYHIGWPDPGKVQNIIRSIQYHVEKKLINSDVCLIFDRYYDFSTKSATRGRRGVPSQGDITYHLQPDSPPQKKKVMLSVTSNKVQLIKIICDQLP